MKQKSSKVKKSFGSRMNRKASTRRLSRTKIRSKKHTSKYSVYTTRRKSAVSRARTLRNSLYKLKYSDASEIGVLIDDKRKKLTVRHDPSYNTKTKVTDALINSDFYLESALNESRRVNKLGAPKSMRLRNKKLISGGVINFDRFLKEFKSQPWSQMSKTTHMELNKPVFMSKDSLSMVDFHDFFKVERKNNITLKYQLSLARIVYEKYSKITDAITDPVQVIFIVDQNDELHIVTNIDNELINEIKVINSRSIKRFLFIFVIMYVYIHPKSKHFNSTKHYQQIIDEDDIPNNLFNNFNETFLYVKGKKTIFAHANTLLLDQEKKTIEYFEPNGLGILPNEVGNEKFFYETIFSQIIPDYDSYTFIPTLEFCPSISFHGLMDQKIPYPQFTKWGYCLSWTMYYIEMRLLNPNLTQKDLVFYMLEEFKIPGSMTTELTSAYMLLTIMAYTISIYSYANYKTNLPPPPPPDVIPGQDYATTIKRYNKKVETETIKKIFGTTKKSMKAEIFDTNPKQKVLTLVDYFHHIPNLPDDFKELLNYIRELCQKK